MKSSHAPSQTERLRAVAATGARLEPAVKVPVDSRQFLRHYYAQVGADDLSADPATLAAAALDHLR